MRPWEPDEIRIVKERCGHGDGPLQISRSLIGRSKDSVKGVLHRLKEDDEGRKHRRAQNNEARKKLRERERERGRIAKEMDRRTGRQGHARKYPSFGRKDKRRTDDAMRIVSCRFPSDMIEEIRSLAVEERVSFAEQVRLLAEWGLESRSSGL